MKEGKKERKKKKRNVTDIYKILYKFLLEERSGGCRVA
jgi:hypothetical protein